ncbi:MFS transporter [Sphaerisporangium sp. NPDC051011]|uniref:MFS transporter n=1 Tax=Sphaerisporangium sp. NPDC051011 TaxID=3155792 RepID=UPI0033EAB16F
MKSPGARSAERTANSTLTLHLAFLSMGYQVGVWAFSLPVVVDGLQMSVQRLGFVLALMAITSIAGSLVAGRLAATRGPSKLMAWSLVWSGLGYAVMSHLGSFVTFSVLAGLTGFGLGLLDVAANVRGAAVEAEQARTLLPRLHALFSLAAAVGALTAFVMTGDQSLIVAFLVAGVSCIVTGVLVIVRKGDLAASDPAAAADDVENGSSWTDDLRFMRKTAIAFAFVLVCCAFTLDATLEGFSALFIRQLPFQGAAQSAIGLAALYLAGATGRACASLVIKRFGEWRTVLVGQAVATLGVIMLVSSPVAGASAVGMLLIGIGMSPIAPIAYSVIGRSHTAADPGRATAYLTAAGYVTFVLAPIIIAFVGRDSVAKAFQLLPVLLVAMAVMTIWFGHQERVAARRAVRPPNEQLDLNES